MTDMEIPQAAVEAVYEARGAHRDASECSGRRCSCGQGFPTAVKQLEHETRALLGAALPHLQADTKASTVIEVHHHDIEKYAEHFNEGYDEANRQSIGGEGSRGWLIGKVGSILEPHFADWDQVADQIADALLSEADLSDADTKAMCETATKVGYGLGRKEAGEEIAEALEAIGWHASPLACAAIARDLTSQPPGAVSHERSGIAEQQEVSEATERLSKLLPTFCPTCGMSALSPSPSRAQCLDSWHTRDITKGNTP